MEGTPTKQQYQPQIKNEPLRLRSYSSLRQLEQQQLGASLGGLRGQGLLQQRRQLLCNRESQRTPAHSQKPQSLRPLLPFPSFKGISSCGSGNTIKFTPNVAVKPEPAVTSTAGDPAMASSGFRVDALLLRSLHSREALKQTHDRFGKPKPWSSFRQQTDQSLSQQQQSTPLGMRECSNNTNKVKRRGPRSSKLSDLAHDQSQGHLFLPITIPFKGLAKQPQQDQQQEQQEHEEADSDKLFGDTGKQGPQQDFEDIDTAASTPNSCGRRVQSSVKREALKTRLPQGVSRPDADDIPPASLLADQFQRDTEQVVEEDGRPEFLQLCFPEVLPPLDVPAMQAQQCERENTQQLRNEQHSKTSKSCSKGNMPTPLHDLPSGRIGQLLIRRSGRVHLRLLTGTSGKAQARSDPATTGTSSREQRAQIGAATELRSGEICYDVLVGTEGSFAQEVGCLLSETNEFIFVGRCARKLIVTADIPRAISPLTQRNC
ncbi:hypothetical protein Efla_001095 [Eimeria flavescens]